MTENLTEMKKNMIIAAAVLASAVACTKEIEEPSATDAKVQMSFAVSTEQTKTVLEGTKQTYWTGVEKLSIFDGESNNLFFAELSAPAATAQFSGKAAAADTYYALYPYSSAAKLSGTTVSTELPAAQTATKGTFDPSAALLFGTADGTNVTLKNLTAMLKLTVPANVTSIEVDGNGTALAGSVNVNVGSSELSGATASKVTLSGKGALEAGTYYIAVAPATVSGLSVKLIDSANSKYILKTASKSSELKANTIYDMGEFNASDWVAESTEPSGNDLVIFDNAFKSGFSINDNTMTEETVDGQNCLKWEFKSAAAWSNYGVIKMDPSIDFANFDADKTVLKFKFKVGADNGPSDVHTLFRVYFGVPGADVWVGAVGHKGASLEWYDEVVNDNEWHELSLSLKDYIDQMSGEKAAIQLGFTPKDVAAGVGTTIYFKDVRIAGQNGSSEPEQPTTDGVVIYNNEFKSGFSVKDNTMTTETIDGQNCLKWEFKSAAAWSNYGVIKMDPAIDFANFDADKTILKFKFKVGADNGPSDVHTLFRVYFGVPGADVWVGAVGHKGASLDWYDEVVNDNEWHELSLSLKDYVAQMSGDKAAIQLGFTPKDVAAGVGTTIYFNDIRIIGK